MEKKYAPAPCKDCLDREVGCHSKCEKYAAFRNGRDDYHREQEKEFIINNKPPVIFRKKRSPKSLRKEH